jgi:hypothetical protein
LEHGLVEQRRRSERRDVEETNLVRTVLVVSLRQLDGLAEIPDPSLIVLFPHVVLVSFGHDEVALVIRPHIQTRHDTARQA